MFSNGIAATSSVQKYNGRIAPAAPAEFGNRAGENPKKKNSESYAKKNIAAKSQRAPSDTHLDIYV